jgi:hypothetical protein
MRSAFVFNTAKLLFELGPKRKYNLRKLLGKARSFLHRHPHLYGSTSTKLFIQIHTRLNLLTRSSLSRSNLFSCPHKQKKASDIGGNVENVEERVDGNEREEDEKEDMDEEPIRKAPMVQVLRRSLRTGRRLPSRYAQ